MLKNQYVGIEKNDSSRKNGDGGVWDTDHNPKLRVPVGYTNVYNNR